MLRSTARRVRDGFHARARGLAGRNRIAASVYYAFANDAFSREAMAVAAGQVAYRAERGSPQGSFYLLRRNIHRLEKGMIMRPRKASFASDYIAETVEVFAKIAGGDRTPEIAWAEDVLQAYFAMVDATDPRIAKAKQRFLAIELGTDGTAPRSVPYARDLLAPAPVDFDAFMALSRRRRSVRWYRDEPVPRALIDRALAAAAQAPSACNRQPFVFRIFDDPARAQAITAIPMGTAGFAQQVPAVAVIVGQLRAYPFERDRHAIYIDGSLAAMSFMYALETLGLSSCPINWPDQEPYETRMRKALGLAADERVIMLVSIGWPDAEGMVPFSEKRGLESMRSYEA